MAYSCTNCGFPYWTYDHDRKTAVCNQCAFESPDEFDRHAEDTETTQFVKPDRHAEDCAFMATFDNHPPHDCDCGFSPPEARIVIAPPGDLDKLQAYHTLEAEQELAKHLEAEMPCYLCADPATDAECRTSICARCANRHYARLQELEQIPPDAPQPTRYGNHILPTGDWYRYDDIDKLIAWFNRHTSTTPEPGPTEPPVLESEPPSPTRSNFGSEASPPHVDSPADDFDEGGALSRLASYLGYDEVLELQDAARQQLTVLVATCEALLNDDIPRDEMLDGIRDMQTATERLCKLLDSEPGKTMKT
jgi:hypothetical protein